MTGLPAKSLSVVPSMTTGPVMIGRPGDAGWISCDPVSWNAIVSRPGLALAALIASRRLQWLALHVPSLTSFAELTVNVVGASAATVVDSLTLLSPASGSGSFAVTDALVSAVPTVFSRTSIVIVAVLPEARCGQRADRARDRSRGLAARAFARRGPAQRRSGRQDLLEGHPVASVGPSLRTVAV